MVEKTAQILDMLLVNYKNVLPLTVNYQIGPNAVQAVVEEHKQGMYQSMLKMMDLTAPEV